jgi:hypothetical protein
VLLILVIQNQKK